jgi:coenzyme Q-binding protein COQ10
LGDEAKAMPTFNTRRRVPFTPQQMFALVADIEKYPQFLPLCERLTIKSRTTDGTYPVLIADMTVGYKAICETFTSRVTLAPAKPAVLVEYIDGPFRHLENRWHFLPAPGGADVDFFISYEFKSMLLQMLVGGVFDRAFHRFTQAFEARARAVYAPTREADASQA